VLQILFGASYSPALELSHRVSGSYNHREAWALPVFQVFALEESMARLFSLQLNKREFPSFPESPLALPINQIRHRNSSGTAISRRNNNHEKWAQNNTCNDFCTGHGQ
jgi:hypothetical protein